MNGILERKCQVLYSISTSISIISTSTTLSTMSFLIALPWRSDHSTWYFQTFGCRISYACEPGYQLLGRTHRSKPCFSLSSLSYVCYFFSPQMCQPSVPLFFVKFQRWKIPKSRALVASAFKKGFPTLICQIVRQTRLEIFPKLPNSPGIYGHGGNLFMILIPLFTINHLSSPPPPSSSSPTSGWSSSSYFRYCQADGSWSPKVLPECKRESVHHLQDKNEDGFHHQRCPVLSLWIRRLVESCTTAWPTTPSSGSSSRSSLEYCSSVCVCVDIWSSEPQNIWTSKHLNFKDLNLKTSEH